MTNLLSLITAVSQELSRQTELVASGFRAGTVSRDIAEQQAKVAHALLELQNNAIQEASDE